MNGSARTWTALFASSTLAFAYPPWNMTFLAWFALSPLLFVSVSSRSWLKAGWIGFLAGCLFHLFLLRFVGDAASSWVSAEDLNRVWVVLSCAGGTSWAAAALMTWWLCCRWRWNPAPSAALSWMTSETVFERFMKETCGGSTAFSSLSLTQVDSSLSPWIASVGGAALLTGMVAGTNGLIVIMARRACQGGTGLRWSMLVAAAALILALTTMPGRFGPDSSNVLAGECVIAPRSFDCEDPDVAALITDRTLLAVWPETALPMEFITLSNNPTDLPQSSVSALRFRTPVTRLIGCRTIQTEPRLRVHNSVVICNVHDSITGCYDKRFLTPYLEYDPAPFLNRILRVDLARARRGSMYVFSPGPSTPTPYVLPTRSDRRLGIGICHDICFPDWSADLMRCHPSPDLLVHCADESSDGTRIGQYFLLNVARLRAMESGRPIVRCAQGGISAAIDARGQVVSEQAGDAPFVIDLSLLRTSATLFPWIHAFLAPLLLLVWSTLIATRLLAGKSRENVEENVA